MIALQQMQRRVESIAPLPTIAVRVLNMADDPQVSPKDIVEVVKLDPGITVRVLNICNSAFYGLSRTVNSLQEAIVLIGLNPLVNIVLTSCVVNLLKKPYPGYALAEGDFWRHSVACAITAELLATQRQPSIRGQAYTAGLLHDVGKIVLSSYVGEESARILEMVEREKCAFFEAEQTILGFNHAQISGQVAEQWKLPAPLCNALGRHHAPDGVEADRELVFITHVANILCLHFGYGLGADGLAASLSTEALDMCDLSAAELLQLSVQVFDRYTKAQELVEA